MIRVAVTGARGFIGGHLSRAFSKRGDDVTAVVRQASARGEVSMDDFLEASGRVDAIVHAAAIRHRHGVGAADYRASNVDLLERIVRAHRGRFERLVLVSSVGVYGFPDRLPISEESPFAPRTLYSATKVHAEARARVLAEELGFELTIVRPTITYGPGDTNGMLDKLVRMVRARRYLVVGSGENLLHHTHIDDMVEGIVLATTHAAAAGDDFILAGPETTTLATLSSLVAEELGVGLPPLHVPLRFARAAATLIDIASYRGLLPQDREPPLNHEKLDVMTHPIAFRVEKARQRIGFAPKVTYREGVARTIAAMGFRK